MRNNWEIDWFVCPECKGLLIQKDKDKIECTRCAKIFNIRNNIPLFHERGLTQSVAEEKEFWEKEYQAEEDGTFQTLKDSSYRKIIDHFNIPKGMFGLEFACGSGTFSDFIDAKRMLGIDISYTLLSRSKSIIPVQGSGELLPFRDILFDFVLCAAALHHIPRIEMAVSEIARVLKPHGYIYIFELNANHPQRKIVLKRESGFRKAFSNTHFSPAEIVIPEKRLKRCLEEEDFIIEDINFCSPEYRHPSLIGKLQSLVSRFVAKGILSRYLESYILLIARKR